jgi:hypothetical protein
MSNSSRTNNNSTVSTQLNSAQKAKRRNEREQEAKEEKSNSQKKVKGFDEVFSMNTNISVAKGLKWPLSHAIRELLVNCLDEDPESDPSTIVRKEDNRWILTNSKTRTGNPGLRRESFVYATDGSKIEDRELSGKFGYGLKDAIAILLECGIEYVGKSSHGSYKAMLSSKREGDIDIGFNKDITLSHQGAVQIISLTPNSSLSIEELDTAVEEAKSQCLLLREDIIGLPIKYEILDEKNRPLGTIYYAPNKPSEEIFVHGVSFQFKNTDPGSHNKIPLFIYNLNMKKSSLRSRDRDKVPEGWNSWLRKLLTNAPDPIWILTRLCSPTN